MQGKRTLEVVLWAASLLVAGFYLYQGLPKMLGQEQWVDKFATWGYSRGFLFLIGLLESLGAVLLLVPKLAVFGAGLLAVVMLGAVYTILSTGIGGPLIPLVSFLLVAILGWFRLR